MVISLAFFLSLSFGQEKPKRKQPVKKPVTYKLDTTCNVKKLAQQTDDLRKSTDSLGYDILELKILLKDSKRKNKKDTIK